MSKEFQSLIFFLCLAIYGPLLSAQNSYQLDKVASEILVKGSSTLHSWALIAEKISVDIIPVLENKNLIDLDDLYLEIPAKSLKSDKIGMNEDAHEALKAEKFPIIIFEITEVKQLNSALEKDLLSITGNLNLAGVTRKIDVTATSIVQQEKILISGSKELKMSTFDIEPPSAFLGLLKADNEVIVEFDLVFIKKN